MTDDKDKQATRHRILGELESIESLLRNEQGLEPPLLTTPAEAGDEPPLLTESLGPDSSDDDEIPLLTEADPEPVYQDSGVDAEAAAPAIQPAHDEPLAADISTPEETQPSLFDPSPSEASPGDETAANSPASGSPVIAEGEAAPKAKKAENPFLPKHIRDRLQASRAIQQEMLERLSQNGAPAASAAKPSPLSAKEEALVEEVLQRHLPRIEAELREKLRALLRAESQPKDPSHEP